MRYHQIARLNEVRMTQRDYDAAVQQNRGIRVGFEFEVCVPYRIFTPKPDMNSDEEFRSWMNDDFQLKAGRSLYYLSHFSTEEFDSIFKVKLPERPTLTQAFKDYFQEAVGIAKELWLKLDQDTINKLGSIQNADAETLSQMISQSLLYPKAVLEKLTREQLWAIMLADKVTNSFEFDDVESKHPSLPSLCRLLRRKLLIVTFTDLIVYQLLPRHMTSAYDIYADWNKYYDYNFNTAFDFFWNRGLVAATHPKSLLYNNASKTMQSILAEKMGVDVRVFTEYHQKQKNTTSWYIEPDGSLKPNPGDSALEIVTPPLLLLDALKILKEFYTLANQLDLYTSKENGTGLHINISIPGSFDPLKLMMFTGDQWILQKWDRTDNTYATSMLKTLQGLRGEIDSKVYRTVMIQLGSYLKQWSKSHNASINIRDNYISFRHVGGNYLKDFSSVNSVVGRFVRSLIIASDPNLYKNEYYSKLAKLASSFIPANQTSQVNLIRQYINNGIPALQIFASSEYFNPSVVQSTLEHTMYVNTGLPMTVIQSATWQDNSPDQVKNVLLAAVRNDKAMEKTIDNSYKFFSTIIVPKTFQEYNSFSKITAVEKLIPLQLERWASIRGRMLMRKIIISPNSPEGREIISDMKKEELYVKNAARQLVQLDEARRTQIDNTETSK